MVLWLGMHVEIGFLNKDVRFDSAEYDARALLQTKALLQAYKALLPTLNVH
jgi:hypothetical protein